MVATFYDFLVTLNQLLEQENIVLEYWTLRKKDLDDCQKCVHFETSAKEVGVKIKFAIVDDCYFVNIDGQFLFLGFGMDT